MSLETRTSALFKRAEQLRRWEDSDTNRAPIVPKTKTRKVKFSIGCVFLAACAAGEKEKVLSLLQKGADIDTSNVDGLTALHQACIDDNLDMVEFLVENGADVNRGDNEGWTPLHATASCGFISIAKYLIENGADVTAVNNDGDLALDIAECDAMEELLQAEIQERGIDCDEARCQEQRRMLKDAKDWAAGLNVECVDVPHPKTGATALHVASAKGYLDVMHVLLKNDLVDVDRQDIDGWTPLHAAAHWGQREAASILVENLADMEMKNYVGQTPFDVADTDMFRYLEDLKSRQSSLNKEQMLRKRQAKRQSEAPAKIKKVELEIEKERQDENEDASSVDSNVDLDLSFSTDSDTSSSSSETETASDNITDDEKKNRVNAISASIETNRIYPPGTTEQNNISRIQAPSTPPKVPDNNTEDTGNVPSWRRSASFRSRLGNESPTKSLSLRMGDKEPRSPTSPTTRNNIDSDVVLRRTYSFENDEKFKRRYLELRERIRKNSSLQSILGSPLASVDTNNATNKNSNSPIILRHNSFSYDSDKITNHLSNNLIYTRALNDDDVTSSSLNDDEKFASLNLRNQNVPGTIDLHLSKLFIFPPSSSNALTRSLRTDSCNSKRRPSKDLSLDTSNIPVTSTTGVQTITTSSTNASNRNNSGSPTPTSPPPSAQVRSLPNKPPISVAPIVTTIVTPATPPTVGSPAVVAPTTPTSASKLSPGNIFKNFFKSFVPPVRDEESETQRKAHAKRVRETRRSTQGVTLDEIKSAEQLVKKKSQPTNTPAIINSNSTDQNNTVTSPNGTATNGSVTSISATITTGAPTVVSRDPEDPPNALHERRPSWRMRVGNGSKFKLEDASLTTDNLTVFVRRSGGNTQPTRPSSAPVEPSTPPADTVVTLPLRRNSKSIEDKEQDKENDIRNAQATQAVIQRRRRPKRRSTGVVHVDMDEIDPEKQDSNAGGDCDEITKINHEDSESDKNSIKSSRLESLNNIPVRNENGEIDYKKLWEQVQTENERLRDKLRKSDEELRDTKQTLERITSVTSKNSLSELEKREKRAMERKLSEMEEELKQLEALKAENQRLKDENGALIRVVSKLSK